MKKLLSLLTISTLAASVPAPLLANTVQTRVKRDVATLTSNSNSNVINDITNLPTDISFVTKDNNNRIYFVNNQNIYYSDDGNTAIKGNYIPITDGIKGLFFDKNNNIYIISSLLGPRIWKNNKWDYLGNFRSYKNIKGTLIDDYLYFITESNPNAGGINFWKININTKQFTQLNSVNFMPSDIKNFNNNIYFLSQNKLYISNDFGLTIKLLDVNVPINSYTFNFDKLNNVYFGTDKGAFVLKQGETTATKINGINYKVNSLCIYNNYIYFNNKRYFDILSWLKQQSQFTLIDKSKNIVWLRDDQLVANGQVKVKIANTDIDTVKVNGAIMPSPNKNWDFDLPVDSTTVENKDYKIEIAFKVDGKSYTGQIIVSSLLSQPSIAVQKNTSPFGNVASYVYQVPTNDKVGDITLTSDLYYSDTEVKVSLNKPTGTTVQSGVVYGLNDNWQKNGQTVNITGDVSLNATMLNSYQGRFLVETKDSADNSSFYYIALNKDNLTPNFWDTDQGQQFYEWASLNGYNESIKKLNAIQLNKIINESKNWQQLASDSQFASAVADWFKVNGKLSSKEPLTKEQVVEQLKKQIPKDIKIDKVNTSNYYINKVSFELNQSEFKPNDKVKITVKYNNATAEQITLQIKDSKTPDNKKDGDSKLWIIGVVVGVLAGLGLAYWLFKRFVFDKYFLPKIKKTRHDKLVEQVRKEEAEKDAQNSKGGEK